MKIIFFKEKLLGKYLKFIPSKYAQTPSVLPVLIGINENPSDYYNEYKITDPNNVLYISPAKIDPGSIKLERNLKTGYFQISYSKAIPKTHSNYYLSKIALVASRWPQDLEERILKVF